MSYSYKENFEATSYISVSVDSINAAGVVFISWLASYMCI